LIAVTPLDVQADPRELGLTYSHPIPHRNGEAVVLWFRLKLRLETLRQLAARHQPRAVGLGNVVMGLGSQSEIGWQLALEGKALGEQGTQGAAAAQRRDQQGQPQWAENHA